MLWQQLFYGSSSNAMEEAAMLWQQQLFYGSSYAIAEATVRNSISSYTRTAAAMLRQQYRSYAVAIAAAMLWQSYAMLWQGYAMAACMLWQQLCYGSSSFFMAAASKL